MISLRRFGELFVLSVVGPKTERLNIRRRHSTILRSTINLLLELLPVFINSSFLAAHNTILQNSFSVLNSGPWHSSDRNCWETYDGCWEAPSKSKQTPFSSTLSSNSFIFSISVGLTEGGNKQKVIITAFSLYWEERYCFDTSSSVSRCRVDIDTLNRAHNTTPSIVIHAYLPSHPANFLCPADLPARSAEST